VVQFAPEPLPPIDGEEPRIEPVPEVPLSEDVLIQKAIEVLQGESAQAARNLEPSMREPEPAMSPGYVPNLPPNAIVPQE
jgi:hypothetical protein